MSSVTIVDRRLLPQDKHLSNRQRFLARQKAQIKKAIDSAISGGSITGKYDSIEVEIHGTAEPGFHHSSQGGVDHIIAPGNQWFVKGDRFRRPEQDGADGNGGPGSGAGNGGEGEDSFNFMLSKEEFLEYFFADLGLPDLVRKANSVTEVVSRQRAGYKPEGNPAQLDLRRSATRALGRRIALHRPSAAVIKDLEQALEKAKLEEDQEEIVRLTELLEKAVKKTKAISWIDPVDVQYRQYIDVRMPKEKVVLFCMMDVSGSMGEREKDIAKRYFMLLLFLLERNYGVGNVEVVFIRHHSTAEECNEEDFFYKRDSGGTVVSSGLELIHKLILDRYPSDQYNIYIAQASDGDNWGDDNLIVKDLLENKLLPLCQYYTYIDIPYDISQFNNSTLWPLYEELGNKHQNLASRQVGNRDHIWPVFRELFSKEKKK